MITEDYCSYEVAKLLKEKGFDEKTLSYYEDNVLCRGDWFEWNRSPLGHISAPTHQMAMKWLREIFHIHIRLIHSIDESYTFEIYPMAGKYRCKCFEDYTYYSSYEEAVEAALKYVLENLI